MSSSNKSIFLLLALVAAVAVGFVLFSGGGAAGPQPVEQPPVVEPEPEDPVPADEPEVDEPQREANPTNFVREEGINPASGADKPQGVRGRLMGPGNRPVDGADIYLVRSAQGDPMAFISKHQAGEKFVPEANATSDEDGYFELGVAAQGKAYELRILASGLADKRVNNVQILANDWYDAGVVYMDQGVGLKGRVTAINTGAAIVGAEVTLTNADGMDQMYSIPGREGGHVAITDEFGNYEFPNVNPGYYSMTAVAENYAQDVLSRQHLEQSKLHEVNFILAPGRTLAGVVVDPDGAPVESAQVTIRSLSAKQMFYQKLATDHEGRFSVIGVTESPYQIRVESGRFQPREVKGVMGGTTDIRIPLEIKAAVRVQVADKNGRAITRYRLAVMRPFENNQLGRVPGIRPVNVGNAKIKNGEFTYTGLDQGKYLLQVVPLRRGPQFAKSYSPAFEITGGEEPPLVKVTVTQGSAAFGRVLDAKGQPIAGATVVSNLDGIIEDIPLFGALAAAQPKRITKRTTKTRGDGSFRLEQLSAGNYQFEVSHPNYCGERVTGVVIGKEAEVDVGAVQLPTGCTVTGVVSLNGTPAGQLKVTIAEPVQENANRAPGQAAKNPVRRFHVMAISDNQGNFTMPKRIPPGVYELYAQRSNLNNPFMGIVDMQRTKRTIQIGFQEQMTQNVNIVVDQ